MVSLSPGFVGWSYQDVCVRDLVDLHTDPPFLQFCRRRLGRRRSRSRSRSRSRGRSMLRI